MAFLIHLPSDLEEALRLESAQTGTDLNSLIVEAIREKIGRARTFREVCAPFARAVDASEVSDDDLNAFFEEVREEVWREKHPKMS